MEFVSSSAESGEQIAVTQIQVTVAQRESGKRIEVYRIREGGGDLLDYFEGSLNLEFDAERIKEAMYIMPAVDLGWFENFDQPVSQFEMGR